MRIAKVQINLCIRAVLSGISLFVIMYNRIHWLYERTTQGLRGIQIYESHITKTRLFKYIETFPT